MREKLGSQVVSRGGFHVGNGINWKGQVFSKMRNHTLTNRMTVWFFTFNSFYFHVDFPCVVHYSKALEVVTTLKGVA